MRLTPIAWHGHEMLNGFVVAYAMISIGTALRVFVAALEPVHYMMWVAIGGVVWAAALAVFMTVYASILVRPRLTRID